MSNPLIFTVRQERTPPAMLGRVTSTMGSISMPASPLGIVFAGFLIEVASLRYALIVIAASYLIVAAYALLNPAFREMDAAREH